MAVDSGLPEILVFPKSKGELEVDPIVSDIPILRIEEALPAAFAGR